MQRTPSDPPPRRQLRGFSALELLIVVALLLVLTAMFWGFESKSTRKNKSQACQANLRKLALALDIYATDFANLLPFVSGATTAEPALAPLVPRYTTDLAPFICPASGDAALVAGQPLGSQRISYAYYAGTKRGAAEPLMTDHQADTTPKATGQAVFSTSGKPPGNNHRASGGNLLRANGSVEHWPAVAPAPLAPAAGATLLNPKS